MALTIMNRSKNVLPASRRSTVKANALFQFVDTKTGKPTGDTYANFGKGDTLGKYFSLAMTGKKKGLLCGTAKDSATFTVGVFEFDVALLQKSKVVKTSRGALQSGDVFQVPGSAEAKGGQKPSLYIHLGPVNKGRGLLSYNINTKTLAVGTKLNGVVAKVGDVTINQTLSQ